MKLLFAIFFISCVQCVYAQSPDIIRLKNKNGRTIKMFFVNDPFSFETKDGILRNGIIRNIANDSVYIISYNIKTLVNYWGGNSIDTLNKYLDGFYYKDIKRILIKERTPLLSDALIKVLKYGGAGYIILNAANSIYYHDSFTGKTNIIKVGIAALATITGFVLKNFIRTEKFSKKNDAIEYIGNNKK